MFTASIYDAVLRPEFWDSMLDEFTEIVGTGGATLQILHPIYAVNQC